MHAFCTNNLQLGDEVLLVGAPQGLEQTVSSGLISGIRLDNGVRVLQTSAAASPGSSGGPLLNRSGDAIGVMSFECFGMSANGLLTETTLGMLLLRSPTRLHEC